MSRMLGRATRRPKRALAVLALVTGIVLLAGAASATPPITGIAALAVAPQGTVEDTTPSGPVPLMLELKQPAAAAVYADQKDSGASTAAAGQSAAAQKDRNEAVQAALLKTLADKGITVLYQVQTAYNGVAVEASSAQMDDLAALPNVDAVHQIPLELRSNANTVPLIGAPAAWSSTAGLAGQGMRIGVIDTGVDYVHTNFGGRGLASDLTTARSAATNPLTPGAPQAPGFQVTAGDGTVLFPSAKVVGGWDFVGDAYTGSGGGATPKPDPNPEDCPSTLGGGHGSHTSGTATGYGVNADGTTYTGPYDASVPFSSMRIGPGVAPRAQLYMLRVFGCTGSTALTTQAIDWAVDPNGDGNPADHLDVINMSLGSPTGSDDDPSAAASNNASQAGVIVVTSAGNSGDTYYVSGSPGSATRAISTAATTDDQDITDGFQINSPAAFAGVQAASRSANFNWSPSMTPVTADLYYPATNQYGCAAWTGTDLANIAGKIVLVDWRQGTETAFPCGSAVRANNATAAGAKGVIMVDNTPWLDTAIAGNATIPAMYTTSSVGKVLKDALAAGTTSITLTSAYNNSIKLHIEGWNDTVSSFSSRGPQGRANGLKPDISAPGQGVFSTDAGTLNQGKSLNGTSMASPHMAGVMALLKQLHPTWSVEELKALAMNTAAQDLYTGLGHTGTRYGAGRVGAGRVSVPTALSTDVIAFADGGSGAVSVSFGSLEPVGTKSYTRTVKVENKGASDVSYTLGFDPLVALNGVSASFPGGSTVNVPAGGSATFDVQLTIDASQVKADHESTVAETQPTNAGGALPRHWLSEFNGLVKLTPASGTQLRVPVYAVVRPASDMKTLESTVGVTTPTGTTTLHLTGTGVGSGVGGSTTSHDYNSIVSTFELQGRSPKVDLTALGMPESARDADIKQVGVTSDARSSATPTIYFAVTTWKDWSTPGELSLNVLIDTGGANGAAPDYNVFVARLNDGTANANPVDVWLTAIAKLPSTSGPIQGFLNVFNSGLNTGLFNNNQLIVPIAASSLGMTAPNTRFNYTVQTASRFWGTVDTVGPFTFDYANPGIDFTGGVPGLPLYNDLPGNTIAAGFDQAAFDANHSLGALLLHHFNAGPDRAQELNAGVVPATSVAVSAPAVQYSDPATLSAKVTPASDNGPLTGVVTFTLDGATVGSAPVDSSGVATLAGLANLRTPGSYPVTASFQTTSAYASSTGSGSLTVTKEDAVANPDANDPEEVAVTAPNSNKSKPFTLTANVTELADGHLGDISNAQPVTFTLTPEIDGTADPAPCTGTVTVNGGTLTASCTFANLPVNVYDVTYTIGGSYYTGTGGSVVTVYDPSDKDTFGAGTVRHDGMTAAFGFHAEFKRGKPVGSVLLVQINRTAKKLDLLRSTSLTSITNSGKTSVITGKAFIAGVGIGSFKLVVVDNAKNGKGDTIALTVTGPNGATVASETFPATAISTGNIRVGS